MKSPLRLTRWLALSALLAAGLVAHASPADEDEADRDERAFRRQTAQRLVRENCLICHSEELISASRITTKQWRTEVEKMVGWGTPLAKDEVQPVIDYLAAEYPVDAAPARPARQSLRQATAAERTDPGPAGSAAAIDLAKGATAYARNCANCHGADGQGADLGPNLVEKPVLWRVAGYTDVVRKGRGRMPGFAPLVDRSSEAAILDWLRSKRHRATIPAK